VAWGFIDHHDGIVTFGHRHQIGEIRAVAVHAVDALDREPGPPASPGAAPLPQPRIEGLRVVVRNADHLRTATAHPFMNAGMDQFVVQDDVAVLRQRREDREIGGVAGAEIERGLGAEIGRGLRLQRFVLGMIAAQQPRPARPLPARRARLRRRRPAATQRIPRGPDSHLK